MSTGVTEASLILAIALWMKLNGFVSDITVVFLLRTYWFLMIHLTDQKVLWWMICLVCADRNCSGAPEKVCKELLHLIHQKRFHVFFQINLLSRKAFRANLYNGWDSKIICPLYSLFSSREMIYYKLDINVRFHLCESRKTLYVGKNEWLNLLFFECHHLKMPLLHLAEEAETIYL